MSQNNQPATRNDVKQIVKEVVTASTKQILNAVGDQFDIVNDRLDNLDATTNRIESKLDATADKVDGHEVRIKKLEAQAS